MLIYNIKRWIYAPNFLVVNTDCLNFVLKVFFFLFA